MENNSSQESHVEGKVNDQQVKNQKGGLGSKSRHFGDYKVLDGTVTFKGFSYEVGKGNSQYINGRLRLGVLDDKLDEINSYDDLKAFLDKLLEERKGKKENPNKFSKKSEDELLAIFGDVLKALEEKTGKSPEELCKDAQEAWKQRRREELKKRREELLARAKMIEEEEEAL